MNNFPAPRHSRHGLAGIQCQGRQQLGIIHPAPSMATGFQHSPAIPAGMTSWLSSDKIDASAKYGSLITQVSEFIGSLSLAYMDVGISSNAGAVADRERVGVRGFEKLTL